MNRYGFTLIELILYVGLITIILSTVAPFVLTIIQSGVKSATSQEVYSSARYVSERIKSEIRNANSIYEASSTFGVNFATSSGVMFSLNGGIDANPTNIEVVSGAVRITEGTSTPVLLNSSDTIVTNLTFYNYSTTTITRNIGFTLTMTDSATTTRQEYMATSTIKTSVELRSFQ